MMACKRCGSPNAMFTEPDLVDIDRDRRTTCILCGYEPPTPSAAEAQARRIREEAERRYRGRPRLPVQES